MDLLSRTAMLSLLVGIGVYVLISMSRSHRYFFLPFEILQLLICQLPRSVSVTFAIKNLKLRTQGMRPYLSIEKPPSCEIPPFLSFIPYDISLKASQLLYDLLVELTSTSANPDTLAWSVSSLFPRTIDVCLISSAIHSGIISRQPSFLSQAVPVRHVIHCDDGDCLADS